LYAGVLPFAVVAGALSYCLLLYSFTFA